VRSVFDRSREGGGADGRADATPSLKKLKLARLALDQETGGRACGECDADTPARAPRLREREGATAQVSAFNRFHSMLLKSVGCGVEAWVGSYAARITQSRGAPSSSSGPAWTIPPLHDELTN
jgi:hypothetical protein